MSTPSPWNSSIQSARSSSSAHNAIRTCWRSFRNSRHALYPAWSLQGCCLGKGLRDCCILAFLLLGRRLCTSRDTRKEPSRGNLGWARKSMSFRKLSLYRVQLEARSVQTLPNRGTLDPASDPAQLCLSTSGYSLFYLLNLSDRLFILISYYDRKYI